MCLAVPGQVIEITPDRHGDGTLAVARVDFQGSQLDASLVFVPEVQVGDWVLVHAGFAIQQLSESEARLTWQYLDEADRAEVADAAEARSADPAPGAGGAG